MGDNNTPPSGKRMPDGTASPKGVKRNKYPDGESPNVVNNYDGDTAIFPLTEKDYLPGAAGQD